MFTNIIKRDGRLAAYDINKIAVAISKAMEACGRPAENAECQRLATLVEAKLSERFQSEAPGIEDIQDTVETVLMENGYAFVARKYIIYRTERTKSREMNTRLMRIYDELTNTDSILSDMKRDNANIDGDTAMGTMLKYGSEGAKDYYEKYVLTPAQSKAHTEGDIHIHDFDFYTLTTTCCQINLLELFKDGFSTGHGFLREPNDISSYTALACIAIQSNQNDQHGGQSVPNFDFCMAPGVAKTFKKLYIANFHKAAELLCPDYHLTPEQTKAIFNELAEKGLAPTINMAEDFTKALRKAFKDKLPADIYARATAFAYDTALAETDKHTFQAMEALVHNLNTMHSRAGAQTPFSSINYGTDTSPEGRIAIKNILLATEAGLGQGETPIFPIHIFKVKEGVSFNPGDPNYDLFKLACRVSAKRLFPNFSFIDAPFNLQYYKPGHPETEVSYMGCRTRVLGNHYDPTHEITYGRGNLSFTSINLPRIGIKANHNLELFFDDLERKMDLVANQLLDRFKIQAHKKVRNFPFLMGQGVWIGSKSLDIDDEVGEVLKNGTLSIGFIGLAETLVALTGQHHGESLESRNLGLEIISFMREYCDRKSEETGLNFTLLATPAEGLSGRFVRLDKKKFGIIPGVTDRDYYTNSFHVPVYYNISAFDKLSIEAPYHALTNAGHISYVELDGDTAKNVEAFESVVRFMKKVGIGYGSINHPVDRDPVCGYSGIINEVCPRCGRHEGEGISIEKLRQIKATTRGNAETCGYCGDVGEEHERQHHPNKLA